MKCCHEHIFNEISEMIVNNLELLYNFNDNALINIRKYCLEHYHTRYKPLDYKTLVYFLEEAVAEIINCDFLYDFRDME